MLPYHNFVSIYEEELELRLLARKDVGCKLISRCSIIISGVVGPNNSFLARQAVGCTSYGLFLSKKKKKIAWFLLNNPIVIGGL